MAIKINHIKIKPEDDGIRVDRWFTRNFPNISFTAVAKLARKGQLRIDGKRVQTSTRVLTDQEIRFPDLTELETRPQNKLRAEMTLHPKHHKLLELIEQNILYKDEDILAINKIAGLAVQGGTKVGISLDDLLPSLKFESADRPKLIHRLDKETSGVLLVARNNRAAAELSELIRTKQVNKTYLAILCGVPEVHMGEIDLPLAKETEENFESVKVTDRGKKALTRYKVLDYALNTASLVEFKLITGKTHQLRVHSASMNCPILGDEKYNNKEQAFEFEQKLYLHSYITRLSYKGKDITIKAPIPEYFKDMLDHFGLRI